MTEATAARANQRAGPDPWKSFRGVMAGTLILEAIVVLLALPVVARADGGLTPLTGGYLIGLAVVLVLLAGVQGRPWAIWVNLAMQLVLIAGWRRARRRRLHRRDLRARSGCSSSTCAPKSSAGRSAGCCRDSSGRRTNHAAERPVMTRQRAEIVR